MSGLPCPTGCGRQRRSVTELLCSRCWYRVPTDLRSAVWRAWRRYERGEIELDELRGVQGQAIEAVEP